MNHLRVFRRIELGHGRPRFEIRSFSGRSGGLHNTIAEAARAARAATTLHGHVVDVFVEFRPEHDFEWPMGQAAYRCDPLNARERHEFYEAFVRDE